MLKNKFETLVENSSFRDPSGFIFYKEDQVFRFIGSEYAETYDLFMRSRLYQKLVEEELLIPHEEVENVFSEYSNAYKIVKPKKVDFISYPYEWCYSQWKDAALTTLKIQKLALDFNFSLKDSPAFNIQFFNGKPILIDTLSFRIYQPGKPWDAYRQFCQHFLAPLALISLVDFRAAQLFRVYLDGIPLELANLLLPFSSRFKLGLLMHLHLHANTQRKHSDSTPVSKASHKSFSKQSFYGLVESLEKCVMNLSWINKERFWENYYSDCSMDASYLDEKKRLVNEFIDTAMPKSVWDIGANTGLFSRIASGKGIPTLSLDFDFRCVEENYLQLKKNEEKNHLPLYADIVNPTPSLGWENDERKSLLVRGPTDLVMALALVHHLAISNNLQLPKIASFFSRLCNRLIIEFVPKEDPMVQKLLSSREDIFAGYSKETFELEFSHYFILERLSPISNSSRLLYLFRRIES